MQNIHKNKKQYLHFTILKIPRITEPEVLALRLADFQMNILVETVVINPFVPTCTKLRCVSKALDMEEFVVKSNSP